MSIRNVVAPAILAGLLVATTWAQTKDNGKEQLKALHEYIGQWKANGSKEAVEWTWKIKGDDVALGLTFKDSKQFTEGVMKYLVDKKKYELTLTTADKKKQVYLGEIKGPRLILVHDEAVSKDKYTLEFSTNNEGARMVTNLGVQKKGVGIAKKLVAADYTREGASLAGGKKPECIVTGGAATMTVSFGGKTYYVCCTGCRDEFNANAKKYVDEYEKSQKK